MKGLLLAAAGGITVGLGTQFAHAYLPGQARLLGNSAAAWLVAAFVTGALARARARGATLGALVLIVAVPGFYLSAWIVAGTTQDYSAQAGFWLGAALVGGPLYGWLGAVWRSGGAARRAVAAAAPGAAMIAEAVVVGRTSLGQLWHAAYLLEAIVGLAAAVSLTRTRREAAVALVALPALCLAGVGCWLLALHLLQSFALYDPRWLWAA